MNLPPIYVLVSSHNHIEPVFGRINYDLDIPEIVLFLLTSKALFLPCTYENHKHLTEGPMFIFRRA